MAILGLLSTESFSTQRFLNWRREVFYQYPNGTAPLIGLLSLMAEGQVNKKEETDDPEFNWFEKLYTDQRTTTVSQGSSKGPFLTSGGTDAGDPVSITADATYQVKVADTSNFRIGHIIKISVTRNGATGIPGDVKGTVTSVDSTNNILTFRALEATTLVDNGTTNENVSKEVMVIGHSAKQGDVSQGGEVYHLPTSVSNYCGISRNHFTMTGTALKTGAKFDQTGPYKDKAKEHSVNHMTELERAFMFGARSKYLNPLDGLPYYTTGGVLWFLQQWEAGTVFGNTAVSTTSAATHDADDNARIIYNTGGTINNKTFSKYMERLFRVTSNRSNEKLCLCGTGFMSTINQMWENKSVLKLDQGSEQTYGMSIVSLMTPWGVVHFKTHPLFNINPTLRYNGLFLDVWNLKYRYVDGRDTQLLKNRQQNDADFRKDEWLTEAGLELRMPMSHMYMQNLQDHTP